VCLSTTELTIPTPEKTKKSYFGGETQAKKSPIQVLGLYHLFLLLNKVPVIFVVKT